MIISPRGPKGAKNKKRPIAKRTWTYIHIHTFPYDINQNLIGYGVFILTEICKTLSELYVKLDDYYLRKYKVFTLTPYEDLWVKRWVNCIWKLWPAFSFSMGPVAPRVENPCKNTALGTLLLLLSSFYTEILCWAPWISQVQSMSRIPSIFLRALLGWTLFNL